MRAVIIASEEVMTDYETSLFKKSVRGWVSTAVAVGGMISLSVISSNWLHEYTAGAIVATVALLGNDVLTTLGAPVREYLLPKARLWNYQLKSRLPLHVFHRNGAQVRQQNTYFKTGHLIMESEEEGRITGNTVKKDMRGVLRDCHDCVNGREQAIHLIAELLTDLAPEWVEFDLKTEPFAKIARANSASWPKDPGVRMRMIDDIMTQIRDNYDLKTNGDLMRAQEYEAILKAWFMTMEIVEGYEEGSGI